jgi:ATP-dependent Clp protease ATP-binding subunit ClpX
MIPEFVGRLPLIVPVLPLAEDELMQVLVEPKNAVVKQYQKLFEMEGAALEFTEEGLREIIGRARKRETGARALRATVENLMLDLMFELPSMQRGLKFVVTPEFVRGEGEVVVIEERHRETA